MNKLQQRVQQRGQGGFTLIELLVVIAILAILAGVVVFAVGNSTSNAQLSSCKTEAASIKTAVAAAEASNLVNTTAENYTAYLESTPVYFAAPTGTLAAKTLSFGTNAAGVTAPLKQTPAGCLGASKTTLSYDGTPAKFGEN